MVFPERYFLGLDVLIIGLSLFLQDLGPTQSSDPALATQVDLGPKLSGSVLITWARAPYTYYWKSLATKPTYSYLLLYFPLVSAF